MGKVCLWLMCLLIVIVGCRLVWEVHLASPKEQWHVYTLASPSCRCGLVSNMKLRSSRLFVEQSSNIQAGRRYLLIFWLENIFWYCAWLNVLLNYLVQLLSFDGARGCSSLYCRVSSASFKVGLWSVCGELMFVVSFKFNILLYISYILLHQECQHFI